MTIKGFFKPGWTAIVTLSLTCLSSALAQPSTSLSVQVTGGDHEGAHKLTSADSYCTVGNSDADSWDTSFGDNAPDPGGLSVFVLTLPHIEGVGAGTSDFFASAGFGAYGDEGYTEYTLDPTNANGSGTLTLEQEDRKRAVVTVTGETAEGVTLSATLTCNDVTNMSGDTLTEGELSELSFAPSAAAPTGSLSLSIGEEHYDVQTGDEATCYPDVVEDDLWYEYYHAGGTYADLTVVISSLGEAERGTSNFGFGIDLAPVHKVGDDGTITATRSGDQLTLVMDTQTAEGTPIHATITCTLP